MIIGISGHARSGKDLLFSFAAKEGWEKLSFAEDLKRRAKEDFGLTEEHVNGYLKETPTFDLEDNSPRELLIDLGNLYRRYKPLFWVEQVMIKVQENPNKNYMITDVRFPNEANAICNYGGTLIRLERHSSRDGLVSEETKQSISETALDNYTKWDFKLEAKDNETLEQLAAFWAVVSGVLRMKI